MALPFIYLNLRLMLLCGDPLDLCIVGRLAYCDLIKRLSLVVWQYIILITFLIPGPLAAG